VSFKRIHNLITFASIIVTDIKMEVSFFFLNEKTYFQNFSDFDAKLSGTDVNKLNL